MKRQPYTTYIIEDANGDELATIDYLFGCDEWQIKIKNRNGGWNYAIAASLAAAKRKATKMTREEAK